MFAAFLDDTAQVFHFFCESNEIIDSQSQLELVCEFFLAVISFLSYYCDR
jgi:hypothetical protein